MKFSPRNMSIQSRDKKQEATDKFAYTTRWKMAKQFTVAQGFVLHSVLLLGFISLFYVLFLFGEPL